MSTQGRANGYLPASEFTRKERIVIDDHGYHYKTREDGLVVPSPTESTAKFDLNQFIHAKRVEQELSRLKSLKVG